jgi:hypothetical protein
MHEEANEANIQALKRINVKLVDLEQVLPESMANVMELLQVYIRWVDI